ncbi:hypothetical protein SISSUDRAFT_1065455 [Sistotremastrum suecicum HHB10207 ss-3]|uniref:Major facilitator superfamily (MFS) profile domain-containing protein n=1 Tax=Sistotremastrum suecicum HHB10207 ss-3 TaxID=1314776 RepID=A0A165ZFC8_9AGAM|nr:hypothetical protein SISSUDRAFT_1065455 [Sistotremastrum suecicum HHB10207 ss-3]
MDGADLFVNSPRYFSTTRSSSVELREPLDEEGGWNGWLTVAGVWFVQFVTAGHTNAFGLYEDFYKENYLQNNSGSAIAWIGSVQISLLFAMGFLAGPIVDKGYLYVRVEISNRVG